MKPAIITLFLLLACVYRSPACRCSEDIGPFDAVFTGKVLSRQEIVTAGHHRLAYRVLVTEKHRGQFTGDTVTVYTGYGGGDCGVPFVIGGTAYIYAKLPQHHDIPYSLDDNENVYATDRCMGTWLYPEEFSERIPQWLSY